MTSLSLITRGSAFISLSCSSWVSRSGMRTSVSMLSTQVCSWDRGRVMMVESYREPLCLGWPVIGQLVQYWALIGQYYTS